MRWLQAFLSFSLLSVGALGAKKSTEERFKEYHTKALSSAPVKLNDASYKELTALPRDYTSVVLLTALDARFGCELCRQFQPEWELLSRSWTKGDKSGGSRVIFSTLDFSDGRETFVSLGLQTAPVLLFFHPTIGPHAWPSSEPLRYDFTSGAHTAEQVHSWIVRHTPDRPHPAVKRPIDWLSWAIGVTVSSGVLTGLYVGRGFIIPIIQSRNVWAAGSLIGILLWTSGHMFNTIRKVPYIAGDGKGGISYFAGGFQNQYGLETQIVAAMYGVLSFAAISLAVKVPRMSDPKTQQLMVLIWSGVLFVMYSFLLSVFRIKNGGYPFSLPPFM